MTGAKKRSGAALVDAVQSKAPKSSTVAQEKNSQIPTVWKTDQVKTQMFGRSNEKPSKKRTPLVAPRVQQSKTEAQTSQAMEKTQEDQTFATTVKISKTSLKTSPKNDGELSADIQKLSPHTGIIIHSFIKQYNDSLKNLKKKDLVVSKKMRAIAMDSLKKKSENITLKEKLTNMELELAQLKTDLLEQQEKNAENIQKYMEINKKYTNCEQHYDKELEIIKACVEKKNSELRDAQSRISLQAQELNNMKQTNRELAGAFKGYKTDLEEAEKAKTMIIQELTGLKEMHEDLQLQFENVSAQKENCEASILQLSSDLNAKLLTCAELEDRIEQLPIEANKALSKLQSDLEASELQFVEQQRLTDQATKELELVRNEINTLKTLIEEKERRHVALSDELTQMTERLSELADINESYLNELTETKLKHTQEIKEQADTYEIVVQELKESLNKASVDFTQLKCNSEKLHTETLLQVSQLQEKLTEMVSHRSNQEELVKRLDNELQEKTHSFEEELKRQQEQLANQMQMKATEVESENKRNAVQIQKLKSELEERNKAFKAQQDKLEFLISDLDKLKNAIINLQAEKMEIESELSTAKVKFSEELQSQKDSLMKKVSELELEIKRKETELIELEREKNNEMAVLQFKMNRINCVIDQPVTTIKQLKDSKGPTKTESIPTKVQPESTDGFSGTAKKRNARRQKITTYSSDFDSGDDMPIVGNSLNGKRVKLCTPIKPQNNIDLFDMLKNSK
ncbi:intracellular protein transport protein USO1 [Drosophila sechellia]|uniref:GM25754 n=1 Tax=Drosophila sechellia TaxID=7238 RepID=B4HLW8_DROSE|nr:intracellular protein transport protein USO1 [Drosophila sechellia]XP_032579136.1 intracellular protein transport protein USO1 [Drosophila sechellia]EDW42005.1 GM25754 [Drosophila sechellia]